ncbi:peptide deformylase [Paracoccus stylophorae]|nr:peptide deformylase [Paracoccus stylophorae]
MPDRADMRDAHPAGPARPALPAALTGGAVRPILIHPDPVLRDISRPAGEMSGPELRDLARDLVATMYRAGGRGLAAVQIGVLRRVFVMDAGWKEGAARPLVMLDPRIVRRSDRVAPGEELCLSIPGRPVTVTRPAEVEVIWFDLDGRRQRASLDGAAARVAQHEADHLDGRLIVDLA